ncbi:Chromosome transmission fidelity protein 18 [Neonectria ditissima]|uniref:Chromosome transmission fidelity protein 18 n=1 Tax=Neonectria ditissima TaxID=78410 RepID=A0A0N8H856_9HYPO|nr:Chromosome transmission fidelity protein 18 [Neonectria ditissima]
MLSASSPITFPKSSPPPAPKRSKPHNQGPPKPKARGPFLIDDDDSDDDSEPAQRPEHIPKRPMIEDTREKEIESLTHNPKPKTRGPFLVEDDESDSDDEAARGSEHVAKRPMLQDPREKHSDSLPRDLETNKNGHVLPELAESRSAALPAWSSQRPLFSTSFMSTLAPNSYTAKTCNGKATTIKERKTSEAASYESMVAARSKIKEGRAKRSYYGIDIHELVSTATAKIAIKRQTRPVEPSAPIQSVETAASTGKKQRRTLLWTEKYRARNFMDLCGDDSTNRLVLRWLKKWDPLVFPGAVKSKSGMARRIGKQDEDEKPHKKILMLTGPPGLGKTTLAHVCARQAGYDVMEINASDDRSRDVVKNRIRTSLGTESVKTVSNIKDGDGPQKVAKPACVIVDEVDGVVAGSGASGEGGFVKALIDLVLLDQKNASGATSGNHGRNKKKGDDFRLLRPLVLICNDVYAPSLRPLRQSNLAEIIHVGKPSMEAVVGRLKTVFEKEGIPCDKDAARKLCEAAWGMASGIDAKRGAESNVEGDLRGVMVVGEWVAGRFRSTPIDGAGRLTRQWIERHILNDLAKGGGGGRGLGRGGVRDIVSRLFQEGGGFPKQALDLSESNKTKHEQPQAELGFGEYQKKYAMERLRHMIDTSGEISHIMTEVFAEYPNREYNDDLYLSKPNQAYDWMHFHDTCQSRLYSSQEWELAPYLSQPVLACHHLFASPRRHVPNAGYDKRWGGDAADETEPPLPFSGPRADYQAFEAERSNRAQLLILQNQLPPTLLRLFRSVEDISAEFLPYLVRLVSPDVKPVVVGGSQGSTASVRKESERTMVKRASKVLDEVGIVLEKGKIESDSLISRGPEYVYRMDPDLDALATFETAASLMLASQAPTRYAVRQVLDQELKLTIAAREALARQARFKAGNPFGHDETAFNNKEKAAKNKALAIAEAAKEATLVKRDFFGRVIEVRVLNLHEKSEERRALQAEKERNIWVTYHEGLNNAVKKPMSFQEFMASL